MEAFQAGDVRERNFGILVFANHLHAHKPILHTTGKGKPQKLQSEKDEVADDAFMDVFRKLLFLGINLYSVINVIKT